MKAEGNYFDFEFTSEMAAEVRELRCGKVMHSWRRIAEIMVERYPTLLDEDLSGNQLLGMDLCRVAARHFNEDYNEEPWN